MENQIKGLEQRMEEQNRRLKAQLLEQNELLVKLTQLLQAQSLEFGRHGEHSPRSSHPNPNSRQFGYNPKLEFPSFNGDNSRVWVQKCEKYFTLCKVPDDQRVDFAAIHMTGKAESWFNSYIAARVSVNWSTFVIDVCARFKDNLEVNVVEQFNKLSQIGSIEDYLDSFEHLKSLTIQHNPLIPDSCRFISVYRPLKSQDYNENFIRFKFIN